jgi:hypothetical protein
LDTFGIWWNDHYLDVLAQLYEATLAKSLCLECGASACWATSAS